MAGTERGRDWVAIIVAIGFATAVNCVTFAVLYDAIFSAGPGLSENATQVLIAWGSGAVGILGAYIGVRAGTEAVQERRAAGGDSAQEEPPTAT